MRGKLSPRERQIIGELYRLGEGSVADVREGLPDPPGYDAVRTTLRILEEKGLVTHRREGPRYVYRPTVAKSEARRAALRDVVRTFFDGSAEAAAVALLRLDGDDPDAELERVRRLIEDSGNDAGPEGTA